MLLYLPLSVTFTFKMKSFCLDLYTYVCSVSINDLHSVLPLCKRTSPKLCKNTSAVSCSSLLYGNTGLECMTAHTSHGQRIFAKHYSPHHFVFYRSLFFISTCIIMKGSKLHIIGYRGFSLLLKWHFDSVQNSHATVRPSQCTHSLWFHLYIL